MSLKIFSIYSLYYLFHRRMYFKRKGLRTLSGSGIFNFILDLKQFVNK